MAENIIIKITSEADLDDAQRQLQELTNKAKEQEKALEDLSLQEREDAESLKQLGLSREQLAKRLKENKRYYREEREAQRATIKETKTSIKTLQDQVKAFKLLQGQSGKAVQQLRAMREELQKMEDAGEFGTQAFIDLSVAAGKLEDQISDTQQRIRFLASDTKELDAAMGLGDGLAGAFNIATSAAEIFGDDMEGLQKAFYKVQAALSIINGLQQVSNTLNKDSNFNVVVSTALQKLHAKATLQDAAATGKATIAQRLLNTAMKANPAAVLLTAISALVATYTILSDVLTRASDKQARLNKLQAENDIKALQDYTNLRINIMQTQNKSAVDIAELEEQAAEEEVRIRKQALDKSQKLWEKAYVFEKERRKEEYKEALREYNDAQDKLLQAQDKAMIARLQHEKQMERDDREAGAMRIKNEIAWREQYALTEKEYYDTYIKRKELAEKEASNQKRLLQEEVMSDNLRAAKRVEIEQQLNATLIQLHNEYISHVEDLQRRQTENELAEAQNVVNAITGSDSSTSRLQAWENYYDIRERQIRQNAQLEKDAIERSTATEKEKTLQIEAINAKMEADILQNTRDAAQKRIEIDGEYIEDLERAADAASAAVSRAQGPGRLTALKASLEAQNKLYDAQMDDLRNKYNAGLVTFQEYKQQEYDITKRIVDAEVEYQANAMQTIADGFSTVLGNLQQISDLTFEAIGNSIQAEIDQLEKMYTTDWEEAQKSADKKYITEKEYEKKKAALEMKQAKYAKAQAIINAGINTALAIVTTLAQLGATPWGIAASVVAAAMGAAQIGIIAAKPLAQYEKGRKGGKGEYALVGEKGPEIMYVPEGASIVPNGKLGNQDAWGAYGVPKLNIPDLPNTRGYAAEQTLLGMSINYERLGEAVANAMPEQRHVTVNVDQAGVHVSQGRDNHTFLNRKYNGTWN